MTTDAGLHTVMLMRELALSAGYAGILRAAAELRLADALGEAPATVTELALEVDADPEALARLLRALAVHGVFAEDGQGRYTHTEMSRLLRADAPRSMLYMVLWATEPWTWALWGRLAEAVRRGGEVFGEVYGKDFFTHLHEDAPDSAQVFDRAMTQSSVMSARMVAEMLDLDGAGVVADIAGGQGYLLATLLERHPTLRGVLFDLPKVLLNPDPRLAEGGTLAGRARLVPGDCRESVTPGADVYVLKNILEWEDESTLRALRNVRAAARPGAKVVVIENLVDGSPEMKFATAMDLLLLLNVGGRRHTKDGLVGLIGQAGLEVTGLRRVGPYLHMIESTVPGA
ncbi:methyltransferase [Sphaerisporangium sp. NPDC004334]